MLLNSNSSFLRSEVRRQKLVGIIRRVARKIKLSPLIVVLVVVMVVMLLQVEIVGVCAEQFLVLFRTY